MKKDRPFVSRRELLKTAMAAAAGLLASPHGKLCAQTAQEVSVGAIDVHAHLPLLKFGGPLAPRLSRVAPGAPEDARALAAAVRADSFASIARLRIADMDRWGVEKTVVMPIDFAFNSPVDTQWEETKAVAEICGAHEDRLIPFMACDPRRPDALDRLDRAVDELGITGIKIHPLAGFAIDDRALCYPFYKKCSELKLPVLGHCRPVGAAERDQLSRPERYGQVAQDFPELKICLGHLGGGPWTEKALTIVEHHENAYGDISTLQRLLRNDPARMAAILRRAMEGPARNRILFGTDWPTQRPLDADYLAKLRAGVSETPAGTSLEESEVALLLRENARGFLGS